jgi:flagellar FliJ protein
MSQLKSIQLAITLATRQRDERAKVVAQALRTLNFSRSQMDQLEGYAGDTDARWTDSQAAVRSSELVKHHYAFMERLQHAISLQTGVIGGSTQQVEAAQQELLKAEFRLAGLQQVLKTREAALQLQVKRREQRQTDEFAAMQFARRKSQSISGENHEH